jgi:KaiC/GvpD/RAD55 family RecA-like ATPase
MTLAEARSSPALYREAAELFKHANQLAPSEPMSLLALAHSSFCRALESGTEFENTRDEAMYLETKRHMDAAASYYLKAGFEPASDYAKATQRLFDAYVFMDNAKKVSDPEKEAKFYLMAEKVLQTSAEAYTRANHAEKNSQVMRFLKKVREEKELALSLSEVLHAPAIASSTVSFGTLSPNEEKAVGLERFEHANIHAKLIRCGEGAKVGEEVSLAIQVVNVGKEPVFLTRVENVLPSGFQFSGNPAGYSLEGNHLLMKGNRLDPLKTETIQLLFKPFRRVDAELKPRIICVDETGRQMLYELEPQILQVSQVPLAGRVSTGTESLDGLLLGGIPEGYSVLLSSPSCDERDLLVRNFLEAGIRKSQETFCVTAEPGTGKALAEQNPSVFHLFVCNPRADLLVGDLPNISKLKGIENLTDIDITLLKSFRALSTNSVGPRRVCLEIVSDVLLQHHALLTRRWIAGLLPELCSKGFTTLAVMNPQMHPPEEVEAILGLFEGEIRISEDAESVGHERRLSIRKLRSQRYLETEIVLAKNELSGEGSG